MKVDGPDLMKEEMDGWDEKKRGYVCVCVTGERKKEGNRLGKTAQPEKKTELRERSWANGEKREKRLTNQR